MKNKELKKLAERMAKLELIIEANEDPQVVKKAKNEIMDLSGRIEDPEDMFRLDELIQEILSKNS
jgi:hypothetical protein